jgi:hypothetical protein
MARAGWILAAALLLASMLYAFGRAPPAPPAGEAPAEDEGAPHASAAALAGTRVPASAPDRPEAPAEAPGPRAPSEVFGSYPDGASVVGRVIRREGGAPIGGARVELLRPDALARYLDVPSEGRADHLVATSAGDGSFVFRDAIPGRAYAVRASLPGLAQVTVEPVDLFPGERTRVDDLLLHEGVRVVGRALDHLGAPVDRAAVALAWAVRNALSSALADPASLPAVEAEAVSGEDGRFVLDGVGAGMKTLLVRAPNGAEGGRFRLAVAGGEVCDVGDVGLAGPAGLAGVVAWADGRPVPGARVFAAPRGTPLLRSVHTGEDGAFRLAWLEPGPQVLGVLVPGLPIRLVPGVAPDDASVRIELPLPGRVRGRVVRASDGAPIERFELEARLDAFEHPMVGLVMAPIYEALGGTSFHRADGSFDLGPRAPGPYRIRARAAGLAEALLAPVHVESGATTEVRIELGPGVRATGSVRRASSGGALVGARVHLFPIGLLPDPADGSVLAEVAASRLPDATTDEAGTFALPARTPGRYDLVASHEEAMPGALRGVSLEGRETTGLDLRLAGVSAIEVHARKPGGVPAADEVVWVLFADGHRAEEVTDEHGRCVFRPVPAGGCLVRIASREQGAALVEAYYSTAGRGTELYDALRERGGEHLAPEGGVVRVQLDAPRRVPVTLRLRRAGAPLATAQAVPIREATGALWGYAVVREGEASLELEPGPYVALLAPDPPGTEATEVAFEVPDAAHPEIVIEVDPRGER